MSHSDSGRGLRRLAVKGVQKRKARTQPLPKANHNKMRFKNFYGIIWIRDVFFTQHVLLLQRCWVKNTSQIKIFFGTFLKKGVRCYKI